MNSLNIHDVKRIRKEVKKVTERTATGYFYFVTKLIIESRDKDRLEIVMFSDEKLDF